MKTKMRDQQAQIMDALMAAGTLTSHDIKTILPDISRAMVSHHVSCLRNAGKLHTGSWAKNDLGKWCAVFAAGPGIDAKMPRMSIEELRAKERERMRRLRAAKSTQTKKKEGLPVQRVLTRKEAIKRAAIAPPLMRLGV